MKSNGLRIVASRLVDAMPVYARFMSFFIKFFIKIGFPSKKGGWGWGEEEEQNFITSGNWRGKHNSLGDRIKNTEVGGGCGETCLSHLGRWCVGLEHRFW